MNEPKQFSVKSIADRLRKQYAFVFLAFFGHRFGWLVIWACLLFSLLILPITATESTSADFDPVIGELPLGYIRRLVAQGDYVYAILGMDLVVIHISDPANPVEVGRFDAEAFIFVYDIAVEGQYVYLATRTGIQVISVADLSNLQVVGHYVRDSINMLQSREGYLYLLSQSQTGNSHLDGLDIVSIHQAPQLSRVGYYPIPGAGHRDLDLVGDTAFILQGTSGTHVVNIANPALPYLEGQIKGERNKIAINGNYFLSVTHGCSSICTSYFAIHQLNWLTWETTRISVSTYLFSAASSAIEADTIYAYVGKDVGLLVFNYYQEPFGPSLPIIAHYDVGDVRDIVLTEAYILAGTTSGFYIMPRPIIYTSHLPIVAQGGSFIGTSEP